MRGAVMGQVVFDGADQRRLAIVPAHALDPGPFGNAGPPPVAACDQRAGQNAPVLQRDRGAGIGDLLRHDLGARDMGQPVGVGHRGQQGGVKRAVLDHEAHRAFLDLGGVELKEKGRGAFAGAPVAGLDLKDRLDAARDPVPDANGL